MVKPPKNKLWETIKQHRGWFILGSILVFLLWVFPLGVATAWPALVRDKTLPEWLAGNRWPSLATLTIGWLTLAFFVTLIGVAAIVGLSWRGRSSGKRQGHDDEGDARKRDFIVRQLERFLEQGREINKQPVITSRSA